VDLSPSELYEQLCPAVRIGIAQLQRRQCLLEQARGIAPREGAQRVLAGAGAVREGLARVAADGRLEEMVCELGQVIVELPCVDLLDGLSHRAVQPRAIERPQPRVDRLPDQSVGEAEARAGGRSADDEPRHQRRVERLEQLRLPDSGRSLQDRDGELPADHRGRLEHPRHRVRKRRDPPGDSVAHA
jgi:hypothetical protein